MRRVRIIFCGVALCAALNVSMPKVALADSCETLMCMSGLVGNGSPSSGCGSPIADYFSIIRFDFFGFSPSLTAAARYRYLMSCPGSAMNGEWVTAIQAVWGGVP